MKPNFDLGKKLQEDDEKKKSANIKIITEQTAIDNISKLSFPHQVITGAAGYFADVYKDYLETPIVFLFMCYLTCLGVAVSKRLTIKSELKIQARLYLLIVGESARDRKSSSLDAAISHFEEVMEKFSVCHGLGSAEGLEKLLKKKGNDKTGTILAWDEFKAMVDKCKIANSTLLACLNTLFESNRFENYTKKSAINVQDAHLAILGASTLQTYSRLYDSAFIDIGFPNRVFLVVGTARPQFSFPEKVPQKEKNQMGLNLTRVLNHVGEGLELDITDNARERYHSWYMSLPDSIHSRRLDGYAIRFMMLLAINQLKDKIDLETVNDATALCDWQFVIRKQYDPIDADTLNARMEEAIRRALRHGPLKDWELKRKTAANRAGLWVYRQSLLNLQQKGDEEIIFRKDKKKWYLIVEEHDNTP